MTKTKNKKNKRISKKNKKGGKFRIFGSTDEQLRSDWVKENCKKEFEEYDPRRDQYNILKRRRIDSCKKISRRIHNLTDSTVDEGLIRNIGKDNETINQIYEDEKFLKSQLDKPDTETQEKLDRSLIAERENIRFYIIDYANKRKNDPFKTQFETPFEKRANDEEDDVESIGSIWNDAEKSNDYDKSRLSRLSVLKPIEDNIGSEETKENEPPPEQKPEQKSWWKFWGGKRTRKPKNKRSKKHRRTNKRKNKQD